MIYLITRLPYAALMKLCRGLGNLMYACLVSRRRITLVNLSLAFPDMDESERKTIARKAFQHMGMAAGEMGWIWYRDPTNIPPFTLEGAERVDAALAEEKGVVLLVAHFTLVELCGAIVSERWPVSVVYGSPKNALFADYLLYQRCRYVTSMINNRSIRDMIRYLRNKELVWISPDQSVGRGHGGVDTRYFGQPALSSTGTARIEKMTGCKVLPVSPIRNADGSAYSITFHEPLILDADPLVATQQVNDRMEAQIREHPEQYLWAHKRFKPPSNQYPNPYKKKPS